MLRRLEIKDLALIESAVLEPGPGLTVLSGETGAGKSLLIGAIKGMTGARMGREWVREGADTASLDAIWDDVDTAVPADVLDTLRDDAEADDALYLGRTLHAQGRSVTRIDGRLVPLSRLREVGEHLADIHGQHDTQAIFRPESHLELLDRYGDQALVGIKAEYNAAYDAYRALVKRAKAVVADPEARARILDQLRYQTKELDDADLKVGEEDRLRTEAHRLEQMDHYRQQLGMARAALEGDDAFDRHGLPEGVMPSIAVAEQALMDAGDLDPDVSRLVERVALVRDEADSVLSDITRFLDNAEEDPERLEQVSARLDLISRLKRKYGGSIERMLAYAQKARQKLDELEHSEHTLEALRKERETLEQQIAKTGAALSEARRLVATKLSSAIEVELGDLGMKDAIFEVRFTPRSNDEPHPDGLDRVEFMLSANLGESPKPLARIASGGEAARILLAIKVILADADPIPLLVFDEVDTGVSGATSTLIGRMLRRLGRTHQVLCVTHSAQIAAVADQHVLIEKVNAEGRTHTRLKTLSEPERIEELARILSGAAVTADARRLAEGLRREALH